MKNDFDVTGILALLDDAPIIEPEDFDDLLDGWQIGDFELDTELAGAEIETERAERRRCLALARAIIGV